ncbi:MAG: type II toxin-antitoxin system HicB family antitoxin, partial [Tabrizicola sp.]
MRYAVVIEKAEKGFSGYVPDLPGCVAAGTSVAKVKAALAEVIPFHLAGLREGGEPVPGAGTVVE